MRGVVSLAAALSIPLLVSEGQPFPYRNLILFITFVVILVTLVFQGLTLPWLIEKVEPEDKYTTMTEHQQERVIQKKIAETSLQFLEQRYGNERAHNEHLNNLYKKLHTELSSLDQQSDEPAKENDTSLDRYHEIYLILLERQRALLNELNRSPELDEELIRKYLSLIDMEEFKIREERLLHVDTESPA
jgi:CPA1 family monovalent cation:H+ antiporter